MAVVFGILLCVRRLHSKAEAAAIHARVVIYLHTRHEDAAEAILRVESGVFFGFVIVQDVALRLILLEFKPPLFEGRVAPVACFSARCVSQFSAAMIIAKPDAGLAECVTTCDPLA